jgi:hypothetical protein
LSPADQRPANLSRAAPSAADIGRAWRTAAALLADSQEPDGSFNLAAVASLPRGGPDDNLFSTATVLALASSTLSPDRLSRAGTYIRERRLEGGLWGWGTDGTLPPDSDDTAVCLGALVRIGVDLDVRREARLLRRFWRWGGPFRTWRGNGGWQARDRDDAVVNCNVLWALREIGARLKPAELRVVRRMVAAQDGPTRYYCSPASLAWAAARVDLATPQLNPPTGADLWERPLECALWSLAGRIPANEGAAALLAMREADGGWSSEPWVRGLVGAWQSRPVTIAFALAALRRAAPET